MFRRRRKIKRILTVVTMTVVCYTMMKIMHVHHFLYNDACALPASWLQGPLHAETLSDMEKWSFQNIITCPKFTLYDAPFERRIISLSCDGNYARLISTITNKTDIYTVPFADECLINFIDNCCLDGRTVPNVAHYVWFSDTRMDFFHFLSFISVVKFVKPCLILIHGPFRPHGVYWDYFVHVFPNIIHVKRNHTKAVKNNKLAFAEHGSDVMRIEALEGKNYINFILVYNVHIPLSNVRIRFRL